MYMYGCVSRLVLYPLFFEGILAIASALENPFGGSPRHGLDELMPKHDLGDGVRGGESALMTRAAERGGGDDARGTKAAAFGEFPALQYSSWISAECDALGDAAVAARAADGWWRGTGLAAAPVAAPAVAPPPAVPPPSRD